MKVLVRLLTCKFTALYSLTNALVRSEASVMFQLRDTHRRPSVDVSAVFEPAVVERVL
jgi:hypothetical protein